MSPEIHTIRLQMPFKMGLVNCYLISTHSGYILIDTGPSNQRQQLQTELETSGCQPGNLKLIVLTHGDSDHSGNAAYLRSKDNTRIAMHKDDSGMVEHGDMTWNRNNINILTRIIFGLFFRLDQADRITPDIYLEDGQELSSYGFDAKVLSIPGHSMGSIGILSSNGDLCCGDLLENTKKPALNAIMDDPTVAHKSVEKLKNLEIKTIYPGHGEPFSFDSFIQNYSNDKQA
jgi:hydroxyacylglutathione hydrolase